MFSEIFFVNVEKRTPADCNYGGETGMKSKNMKNNNPKTKYTLFFKPPTDFNSL